MWRTTVLNLPTFPSPGESVYDGKFYWPISLWEERQNLMSAQSVDESNGARKYEVRWLNLSYDEMTTVVEAYSAEDALFQVKFHLEKSHSHRMIQSIRPAPSDSAVERF